VASCLLVACAARRDGLGELGKPGSGGLDEPILDDKLVGFPGAPGDTSPNP
jgi:hypothetical protein